MANICIRGSIGKQDPAVRFAAYGWFCFLVPCLWRVLLLAGGSVRYNAIQNSKDTAKLTTKALLSPGNAFRGWSSLPGTLSMKTVSRLGLSASKAFLSEIIRNSSFSTGRVLNSSPTLPTRPVRSVSSQSCASHNLSMSNVLGTVFRT